MSIENWIDQICKVWGTVGNGQGGHVRSYLVYEKEEFPEAITVYPCAITYTTNVIDQYSVGGPLIDHWKGVTEFHLFPSADKRNFPAIMLYFSRIRNAAAANMQLGGRVAFFQLRQGDEPSIEGPVVLRYGGEDPHHGLIVHWICKQSVSGETGYVPAA